MHPSDLPLLHSLGVPTIAPDGGCAAVSLLRPDLVTDSYVGGLWLVPLTAGLPPGGPGPPGPRRLTQGRRDTAPAYSPDGQWIAFLRVSDPDGKGPASKPQLHLLPTAGGDAVVGTASALGVGAPRWSPDSSRLVVTARIPEPGRYGTGRHPAGEGVGADAEPPRLITKNQYRIDGTGFLLDRPQHLLVVDVPREARPTPARQITHGEADANDPCWSPDGSTIAFTSPRQAEADEQLRNGLRLCDAAGDNLREAFPTALTVMEPTFSPDAATLWFLAIDTGPTGVDFVGRTTGLWSLPVDGTSPPTLHTDPEADDLAGPLTVDAHGVVRCHRLNRGAVELVTLPPAGNLEVAVGGPRHVQAHAVAGDGTVVFTSTDWQSAGEVGVLGVPGALTDFGAELRETGRLAEPREVDATADDGYPVHGWVMTPPGPGPHPVLLFIHGGPYAQYGWTLFDEFLVAVTAGYAVVFGNPRGSAGYGEAHGRSIRLAMGTVDATDVLTLLDAAIEADPSLDGSRIGVMGGSYGGYLTALLTTRTARFAGAIVERGFLDPVSFTGSSDIGWIFGHEYVGDDPAQVAAQSPMAGIAKVAAPTLVIHSEQDWRCPVEQGQRWYAGLKRQGVETELLLFPGEGHELTRSGRPKHRVARFDHVLRWWSTHL